MRMIRPKGEKLTHKQLVNRAEAYRAMETALYYKSNEFADKLQRRFHRLAVQYERRADAFMVVQPPLAPPDTTIKLTRSKQRNIHSRLELVINDKDKVFVLTGAGISAESGLPTFRAPGGLWSGPIIEQVCTPDAWATDPWRVWQFYSFRRDAILISKPNPAHYALARLEAKLGDRFFLCTQNIDDLHEKAGSSNLVHIHGEIRKSRCSEGCSEPVEDLRVYKLRSEVPRCVCGALMRPHVVFFDESPINLDRAYDELYSATVMLVIGTSGVVQPAASMVSIAKRWKVRTIYVGIEEPKNYAKFSEIILGKAGEVLPALNL